MSKNQSAKNGRKHPSADVWASPEMAALDRLITQVVNVPKAEVVKLLAAEKAKRDGPKD